MYEHIDDERSYVITYEVGDNSGEFSERFNMAQYNTVVTDDEITITLSSFTMKIFTLDGDNAAFYQELLPLEDFDVRIQFFPQRHTSC